MNLKVVYFCHRSHSDPRGHAVIVRGVCRRLSREGSLPLGPQLLLPPFVDERRERDLAMRLCPGLVALSDDVRVYGDPTGGMRFEIAEARRLGIPVSDGATRERILVTGEPPR